MTKLFGILAYPAKHSLSPVMFDVAFKEAGIDAQYRVYEVREEDLRDFMDKARHEPISGLSVSLPHKESVMRYLDVVDEDAKKIGAVNTVLNKGGFLHGYNTDFVGAVRALKEVVADFSGKRVVVIGAGGAARAVVYGVMKEGADVFIMNRTADKAASIASEFTEMFDSEIRGGGLEDLFEGDVLINATSIWTKDSGTSEDLPVFCEKEYLEKFEMVVDISYSTGNVTTPFIQCAKEAGVKNIITADKMLLYQAASQFKIWTGKEAPIEVMREALGRQL